MIHQQYVPFFAYFETKHVRSLVLPSEFAVLTLPFITTKMSVFSVTKSDLYTSSSDRKLDF